MYVSNAAERLGRLRQKATPPRNLSAEQDAALSIYDLLWWHLRDAYIEKIKSLSPDDLAFLKDTCVNTSDVNCSWTQFAVAELVYHCCEEVEDRRAFETALRPSGVLPERT